MKRDMCVACGFADDDPRFLEPGLYGILVHRCPPEAEIPGSWTSDQEMPDDEDGWIPDWLAIESDEDEEDRLNLGRHSAAESRLTSRGMRWKGRWVDSILERLDAEEAQARGRKD